MHIDLDVAPAEHRPGPSPYLIVGGGIAGLVLADKLARFGLTATVLEGGGLELEERSQALYAAEMAASLHTGSHQGRFRTLGGSSTRWGGQLLPFTADIFRPVAGSPSLPWPIEETAVTPYYDEVLQLLSAGALPFSGELLPALGHPAVTLGEGVRLRYSKWAPFGERNLARTVGRRCLDNPHVRLYTHANAVELLGAEGGERVRGVRVVDYAGRSFEFAGETVIVCCGTVESSRLLLASAAAVPNRYDQVGRYFHDHVSFHAAQMTGAARRQFIERLGPFFVAGVLHTCKLEATGELQAAAGMLAVMAHMTVEEPEGSGIAAVRNLLTSVQRRQLGEAVGKNLLPMLRGTGDVLALLWASRVQKRRAVSARATVRLNIDMEQAPVAENRIRLSPAKDAVGMARAVVDWRVGEPEYQTAARYAPVIKAQLAEAGFGPFAWAPGLVEGTARPEMVDSYHPMGGLRMGTDPALSVVDEQLKVHELANLYVASCATYPSGGSSNPTFTLMALTLRLADHLRAAR